MTSGGAPSVVQSDHPLLQAVCHWCATVSAATNSSSRPSALGATVAGQDAPSTEPWSDQPDHPLLQAVCQMCQSSPSMSKTNSSRRPSPLAASSGAPKSAGMADLPAVLRTATVSIHSEWQSSGNQEVPAAASADAPPPGPPGPAGPGGAWRA